MGETADERRKNASKQADKYLKAEYGDSFQSKLSREYPVSPD
jgi:hypothetical protein